MSALTVTGTSALTVTAAAIQVEHKAAQRCASEAVAHAIRAGELLIEAKAALPHGAFGAWLAANVEFSDRTAQGYMRLAKLDNEKRNAVADLSLRNALRTIAESPATTTLPASEILDASIGRSVVAVTRAAGDAARKEVLTRPAATPISGMHHGEYNELAAQIPDESVELVIVDPPWDRYSMIYYDDIARISARILKDGGSLICGIPHLMLPYALDRIGQRLRYWWACCSKVPNPCHAPEDDRGIRNRYRLFLWYVKKTRGDVQSIICDRAPETSDEMMAAHFIEKLCSTRGTVVDLFASNATVAAAGRAGRNWIAFQGATP